MMSIKNLENYNPTKKRKVLIMFDDMKADMEAYKKLCPIATELFIKGRLKVPFKVPEDIRLNATYFIMKIPN